MEVPAVVALIAFDPALTKKVVIGIGAETGFITVVLPVTPIGASDLSFAI